MNCLLYSEWVPAGAFVKFLVSTLSIIIVFLNLIVAFLFNLSTEGFIGFTFSWIILGFILFLFFNYRGLQIQINSRKLLVSYGFFNNKSILLDDVFSCKLIKSSFRMYGGIGVRHGLDGSIAYTTSFGNALKIIPKKGRVFVFSSNNPEKIFQIINKT